MSGRGSGCFADVALGLVGAMVGGWLFSYFGHTDPMRFNLASMAIAIVGAVIVLVIWHAITGRGVRRSPVVVRGLNGLGKRALSPRFG